MIILRVIIIIMILRVIKSVHISLINQFLPIDQPAKAIFR